MNAKQIEYNLWNVFNFLVRRIMGPFWLLAGAYGGLWSLMILFNPSATIDIEGIPSNDLGIKMLGLVISVLIVIFGWLFIRAPKYYPSRVKEWMNAENQISTQSVQ